MTITHHYRGSRVGAFALLAAALAAVTGLSAQTLPSMFATASSTGFLAVTSAATGAIMLDVANDAQGGGASSDFVSYKAGDAVWAGAPNAQNVSTTLASDEPGFYIAAGSVSGVNSVLFRATMGDQNGSKAYMSG